MPQPAAAHRLQHELDHAIRLAKSAGALALSHYGSVERLTKTHAATRDEAVTVADRAAQALIVEGLREAFPEDGIIGEESDTGEGITAEGVSQRGAKEGRFWVIDPIDGTNNFIAGLGNWGVCLGLLEAGRPVVGVVYDPTRDDVYAGAVGDDAASSIARLNDEPTTVRDVLSGPASMVMLSSSLDTNNGRAPQWAVELLHQNVWKVRMLGSAQLEAAAVGGGIADAAITIKGKLWDLVPAAAVTLAAGGEVVQLDGTPRFPYDVTDYHGQAVPFIVTTPRFKAAVLEAVGGG